MTEDDTFNKLRKLTYDEMCREYKRAYNRKPWSQNPKGLEEAEEVCKRHGWKYSDFHDAIEENGYRGFI